MKASRFGGNVPRLLGEIAYSKTEDGIWIHSTTSEVSAILELDEGDEEPEGDGDDVIGYIAELSETDTPTIDVDYVLDALNEQAHSNAPDIEDDWPECTQEQREQLQRELNAVLSKWLTKYKLWPTWCDLVNVRPVLRKQAKAVRDSQSK